MRLQTSKLQNTLTHPQLQEAFGKKIMQVIAYKIHKPLLQALMCIAIVNFGDTYGIYPNQ
jgi:hypothetical protein